MRPKFSEDVIPLTRLKVNPGKIVTRIGETHRPVLLTSRGRGVAVVLSLQDYENNAEEMEYMRAVVEGIRDADAGRTQTLKQAKKRLGL